MQLQMYKSFHSDRTASAIQMNTAYSVLVATAFEHLTNNNKKQGNKLITGLTTKLISY